MSDNPRPVLYGSGYEAFLPRAARADRTERARVVGKHCESGDILIFDAALPAGVEVGDIARHARDRRLRSLDGVQLQQGAATRRSCSCAMGSPAIVVRRETYDDLVRCDVE